VNHVSSPIYKISPLVFGESLNEEILSSSEIEEILSSSEYEDLHALYTNLFVDTHPHEQPSIYHATHSSHYSFGNETLKDVLDKEECPTLIDQTVILNNASSGMYHLRWHVSNYINTHT